MPSQVHVSAKHKALVVPHDPAIQNLFPNAKSIRLQGDSHLVVAHAPAETFILRKLGYDVPAPILTHYNWCGMARPFASQKQTAALLTTNERAYVLNDMGTGKTKTPLWAWDYLRSNNHCTKMLIMAPLSTINTVWMREVFNTIGHRKAVSLHGTKARRLERLKDPDAEIFIINHDGLKVLKTEIFAMAKAGEINVLCIDELAEFRNPSDRSKLVRELAKLMRFVWGMTGKPVPKSPTDAWMQASIVTPHTVPKYFKYFRQEVMLQKAEHLWVPKPDATERVMKVLQPSVRFELSDVSELPECVERFVDVELGPLQAKTYKELATKCYAAVQNNQITAINAAAVMTKLLQVSAGWVYAKDGRVVSLDNAKRLDALMDALASTARKTLVFVPFKHALAGIGEALKSAGVDYALVSGDTPAPERDRIFNFFQNSTKYQVLAAHPECCCHGLTLTAADTAVWFAPMPDLSIYEQANGRIRRVGQKHKQQVIKFQSTPIEKRVYKMLDTKAKLQDTLLELFAEDTESNQQR